MSTAKLISEAVTLLTEALEHITDKPWDDPSLLHARISEFVGREIEYPEHVARIRAEADRP